MCGGTHQKGRQSHKNSRKTVFFSPTDFDNFGFFDVFGVFLVLAIQPTVHILGQLAGGRYIAVALAVGFTDK